MQDELVTIRGDRFVIPVKTEQRRGYRAWRTAPFQRPDGVYEPLETIEQNNELVRLVEDEQAEVYRILLEMTGHIGEICRLLAAADVLSELELQFAKARFAQDYDCVGPELL